MSGAQAGRLSQLADRIRSERVVRAPEAPISRRHLTVAPASAAQRRLWFLEQLMPGTAAYTVPAHLRVRGSLDPAALERSLEIVVERHESLRTTFSLGEDGPIQIVSPPRRFHLPVIDLRECPAHLAGRELSVLVAADARHAFDLERGPLLRARLVRMSDEESVLLLSVHHIVCDGWSTGLLVQELRHCYEAKKNGRAVRLPELPIQYSDYAAWQIEELERPGFRAQLRYWTTQLEGDLPVLPLPFDRLDVSDWTARGSIETVRWGRDVLTAVSTLASGLKTTPFVILLTVLKVLLHRYSGVSDVVVGSPVANRLRRETFPMVGFFVNTVALRTRLDGDPPFAEAVARVAHTARGALTHQEVPFDLVVEAVGTERVPGRNPLFDVMFAFEEELPGAGGAPSPELDVMPLGSHSRTAKLPLTMACVAGASGLVTSLEFAAALFDASTVRHILAQFECLLRSVLAEPRRRLSELNILTDEDRARLDGLNPAAVPVPPLRMHEAFERWARATPDAIAIAAHDSWISYRELDGRANQLAAFLRARGVGPEARVGVCLRRSTHFVTALLGVLKAGGTYVVLDPYWPETRRRFLAEHANAGLVITSPDLADAMELWSIPRLSLHADWFRTADCPPPPCAAAPENAAYIVYTSGSTGTPKGVVTPHRAFVNHLTWTASALGIGPDDVGLLIAPLGFEVAAWECFNALQGGRLAIPPPMELPDAASVIDWIVREEVTFLSIVPSLLQALLTEERFAQCRSLRCVVSGAEALPKELATRCVATVPARLWNLYGPTECTLDVTQFAVPDVLGPDIVPVGRPIANARVYVLGPRLERLPDGFAGEIYVGGAGLARGYAHAPDVTADLFRPDPCIAGERMFRTGDRGRVNRLGCLEYIGRSDRRFKIHGYRVEADEIEAALLRDPDITAAAVVLAHPRAAGRAEGAPLELWPSAGDYVAYDELMYYVMTNDRHRNEAYEAAIREHVRGKTVVDIGTGMDAVLARMCVDAGARKVYAIERLPASYEAAAATIHRLGLRDRIELVMGDAQSATLPELVDVSVSELIGAIGNSEGAVAILNDARRFLKPSAFVIPQRCTTRIAAIQVPGALWDDLGFAPIPAYYVRKAFEAYGYPFDLRLALRGVSAADLISDTAVFEDLDFSDVESAAFARSATLTIQRDGVLHGFLLWLNLRTAGDWVVDNLQNVCNWIPVFLPVFHPGIRVAAGTRIDAVCSATVPADSILPDYRVEGIVGAPGGPGLPFVFDSFHHARRFRATPFYQEIFSTSEVPRARRTVARTRSGERLQRLLHDIESLPEHEAAASPARGAAPEHRVR